MFVLLRRFLVLIALMFWQGGFVFYAGVVVPTGQRVLGSHLEQGMITRIVTNYLNISGLVALLVLAWDCVQQGGPMRVRRWRWAAWLALAVCLVGLTLLHPYLDHFIDPEAHELLEPRTFRTGHRIYLWISTVQWAAGLVFLLLTLTTWRTAEGLTSAADAGVRVL
jgi:hypothetical protein